MKTTLKELERILMNAPKLTSYDCQYGRLIQTPENNFDKSNAVLQMGWYSEEYPEYFDGHYMVSGEKKGREYAEYSGNRTNKKFKKLFEKVQKKYFKQARKR